MKFWTKAFWIDATERAVKTVAQTSAALLTADHVLGLLDVAWDDVASVAGLAGLVSLLTSIGSSGTSATGTAQLGAGSYEYTEA